MRSVLLLTMVLTTALKAMSSHRHAQAHEHHNLHPQPYWLTHRSQPKYHTDPLVFAHYMITYQPPNGDYTQDIKLAQAAGIDAFAVNYGAAVGIPWPQLAGFLDKFYSDAASLNFKLFMSYDLMVLNNPKIMVNCSNAYLHHPAQLWVDGKMFLSSFGTGLPTNFDWQKDVVNKIGAPVMFMPGTINENAKDVADHYFGSGPFTWIHPASNMQQEAAIDNDFSAERDTDGVPWMAGVAPWFFKRMSADENWMHAQDSGIWFDRWLHLLQIRPNFIELVTWNDYGESSYVGPTKSYDVNKVTQKDCAYGGLNHSGFLGMAKVFIEAFKGGKTAQTIEVKPEEEDVYFYYRLQPVKALGNYGGLPLPKNAMDCNDTVTVFAFLADDATVTLNSGGTPYSINFRKGLSKQSIPFHLGQQTLTSNRELGGGRTLSKVGPSIVASSTEYNGNVVAI